MMNKLIAEFPAQIREAIEIGNKAKLSKHSSEIHNILVTGLGGSGMGAKHCYGPYRHPFASAHEREQGLPPSRLR